MQPLIIVREKYGISPQDIHSLDETELDRLKSNSRNPIQNLQLEFEVEQAIFKHIQKMKYPFKEMNTEDTLETPGYNFAIKSLSVRDQKNLIKKLDLPAPQTSPISSSDTPNFPFVVKNPESRKGREVYLIENNESLSRIKKFLTSSNAVVPSLGGLVTYDPAFENEKLVYQDYIETPSDYFTNYRVLISGAGELFGLRITYSGNKKSENIILTSSGVDAKNWQKRNLLTITDSPFFLGSKKIISNHSAGGSGIVLDPGEKSRKPTDLEKEILTSHGLDPVHPKIPDYIKQKSIEIAKYLCSQKLGVLFGIDWIQSRDNAFYYLETNVSPGSKPFCEQQGIPHDHKEAMISMLTKTLDTLYKERPV